MPEPLDTVAICHWTAHNQFVQDESFSKAVIREIVELHAVFEQWFRGAGSDGLDRVERVLAPDFVMVPPDGTVIRRQQLMSRLMQSHSSQELTIAIEQPEIVWQSEDSCLASYQEVQHHAESATRRRSTALFSRSDLAPNGVVWRHVHETWMQPPPR